MIAPTPAYIEIIERGRATDDSSAGGVVVPDEVRINGIPILRPEGETIRIHEMTYGDRGGDEPVIVTLTLFARRVVIAAEGDL